MSNKFKAPATPTITSPVGIDKPIQDMQLAFRDGLTWLDKAFGRAFLAFKTGEGKDGSSKVKRYPHVWQGPDLDLLEVLPNDNLKSQCFFKVHEPVTVTEWIPDGDSRMSAVVSIIFWFDLKRIDDTIDYPFNEILKGQVIRLLEDMMFSDGYSTVTVRRIFETPAQVFADYDINEVIDQELVYPKGGFRLECDVTYTEDCPRDGYQIPPVPAP